MHDQKEITVLLKKMGERDEQAVNKLFRILYEELRAIAGRRMQQERKSHTLQATEIVHEAFIKLISQDDLSVMNRSHFFSIAASAMRQILVDYARRRQAGKRGGNWQKIEFDAIPLYDVQRDGELLAIDEALQRFSQHYERQSKVVELRYFIGFTNEEIAACLDLSLSTVKRDFAFAKAWLQRELSGDEQNGS